jgi:NitT/TauT family transport system substrate-binding protein
MSSTVHNALHHEMKIHKGFLALLLTCFTCAVAQAQTPVKFVIDWAFTGPQAMWSAAAASGCYGQQGLAVTTDRGFGSGDSISKVAASAYQLGVADFGSIAAYDAANPTRRVLAIFIVSDRSSSAVAALKKSGIRKPQDLMGRRIADRQGEAARVMFPALAAQNGLDQKRIEWISVAENLRQAAVVRGEADAAAGHVFSLINGFRALGIKREDLQILSYTDFGVDIPGNAIIARPEWLAQNKDTAAKFLSCAAIGIKASVSDPGAAIASLAPYNSMLNQPLELEHLQYSNQSAVLTLAVRGGGLSSVSPQRLEQALQLIATATNQPKLAPADVYTSSYLPPLSQRSIDARYFHP